MNTSEANGRDLFVFLIWCKISMNNFGVDRIFSYCLDLINKLMIQINPFTEVELIRNHTPRHQVAITINCCTIFLFALKPLKFNKNIDFLKPCSLSNEYYATKQYTNIQQCSMLNICTYIQYTVSQKYCIQFYD